ncbi:MAG: hypothetical protein QOI35_2400 [Cryptosporangiaceae bacterium]|nr:hypothetical protein [Cryptosporangiaceae bacterium]
MSPPTGASGPHVVTGEHDPLQIGAVRLGYPLVDEAEQRPQRVLGKFEGMKLRRQSSMPSRSSSVSFRLPAQYGSSNGNGVPVFSMIPLSGDTLGACRSVPSPVQTAN